MQTENDLQRALQTIQVRFGDQALVRATRLPTAEPWPTGQAAVDRLSGTGGLPRGRVSVLQGAPTSGKLSLGLDLLARASREFAQVVVIDPGGGFDPWALAPMGAELLTLAVVRPPSPAATGEAAVALARAGAGFLLLLGEPPEPAVAALESAAARSGCAVLAVAEAPGRPLAHASSLTLACERSGWLIERRLLVGLRARLACVKNKLAAPGAGAELEVRWPLGARLSSGRPVREQVEVGAGAEVEEAGWRSAAG